MAYPMRRLVPALGALALVAGGCGGGSDEADGSASPAGLEDQGKSTEAIVGGGGGEGVEACDLLTAEEVESAFGVAVGVEPDEQLSTDFQDVCNWRSEDLLVSIQVLVIQPGPQADFDRQRESTEEVLDAGATADTEVPGADRAFTLDGLVIAMEVDDHFVQVSNIGLGEYSDPTATAELAALVAGRV